MRKCTVKPARRRFSAGSAGFVFGGLLLVQLAAKPALAIDVTGTWYGTLVTEQGQCPDAERSILKVTSSELIFAPGGGAIVLRGQRDKEDERRLHAQLMLKDAKGKPMPLVFEGQYGKKQITGVYGTPFCRAHLTLTRD